MTDLAKLSNIIRQAIDDYCIVALADERRSHLGASEVGEECLRQTWYNFRWCRQEAFAPSMLRLFRDGHRTEAEFIEYLRGVGFVIDELNPATGKQWLFSLFGGHYGGSTDGLAWHPLYFPTERIVTEFKTHNEKSFKKLQKEGVKKAKPRHYAQMSNYGAQFGCHYGLYLAKNKNDSNLHLELVELDPALASAMSEKARYIITAQHPPPKIQNASPSFFICKQCPNLDICHYRKPPDRNCRSCSNALTAEGGWYCQRWQNMIPKEFIPQGCDDYRPIV